MINTTQKSKRKLNWKGILLLSSISLGTGFVLIKLYPHYRDLILFGLYSIPSQMLISLFPHEPVLLQTAKYFTPLQICITGAIGCSIAGFLDYWIISPLINHRFIRPKLDNTRLFGKSLRYFAKFPFGILVSAAFSPVPFYPFKFLSIGGNYPLWKYETALIIGRIPRYYLLAILGKALQIPTWVLVAMFVVFLLLPVIKPAKYYLQKGRNAAKNESQNDDAEIIDLTGLAEYLPHENKPKNTL